MERADERGPVGGIALADARHRFSLRGGKLDLWNDLHIRDFLPQLRRTWTAVRPNAKEKEKPLEKHERFLLVLPGCNAHFTNWEEEKGGRLVAGNRVQMFLKAGVLVDLQAKSAHDFAVSGDFVREEGVELVGARRCRLEAESLETFANGRLGERAIQCGVDLQHDLARRAGGRGEADGARIGEAAHRRFGDGWDVANMTALPNEADVEWQESLFWWVPVDDERHMQFSLHRLPLEGAAAARFKARRAERHVKIDLAHQ